MVDAKRTTPADRDVDTGAYVGTRLAGEAPAEQQAEATGRPGEGRHGRPELAPEALPEPGYNTGTGLGEVVPERPPEVERRAAAQRRDAEVVEER